MTKLAKIIADFRTSLATKLSAGASTCTLQSATDDDGVALPSGTYFFTIDGDNSQKEHIVATLSGTSLSAISSISRQGTQTANALREHRVGASVTITNFAHIKYINDLLDGTTNLNASTPLTYDGTASITTDNQLATKAYVDGVAIAGAAKATDTVYGIAKLSVAAVSSTVPIVIGQNDPILPSTTEKQAMAGSSGTPSTSNKFVTEADVSAAAGSSKIIRATSGGKLPLAADRIIDTVSIAGENISVASAPVPVYMDAADGRWYMCDGNVATKTNFRAFAISTATTGNAVVLQFSGIVGSFTGLTKGAPYFISDTVGTISTTAGTFEIPVGIATSTTEITIFREELILSGTIADHSVSQTTSVFAETNDVVVTLGYRPKMIILSGQVRGAGGSVNGSSRGIVMYAGGVWIGWYPGTAGVISSVTAASDSPAIVGTLSILSVSNTGFTVREATTWTSGSGRSVNYEGMSYIAIG